jgi:hypothetical protein
VPFRRRIRARARSERGSALVLVIAVVTALGLTTTSAIYYTTSTEKAATYSRGAVTASTLAEAGINEAAAVLFLPANNALDPNLLPATSSTYAGGTVAWSGTLDQATSVWTLTATGRMRNTGVAGAGQIARTVTAKVTVSPTFAQPLNNQAWNYIYSFHTGWDCDMTLQQSVALDSPLYVDGNLCLQNTATITRGPLVVKGRLTLYQRQNGVGSAAAPISEAHIANGCRYQNNPLHGPCAGPADNVYATTLDSNTPPLLPPTVGWDAWYANASPGPRFPCYGPKSSAPATWPTFDNDTARNDRVLPAWNLTPGTSYDCWTAGGELAWNAATQVLTVKGTVFIDGSAYISNGAVNGYDSEGSLYLSGTFLLKNSMLCAIVKPDRSGCDTTSWNPNQRMLVVVANGNGDNGVPAGSSIQLVSAFFQGSLYGTNAVQTDTTSQADGPIVASVVALGQSVNTSFPFITIVPVATPGNPTVYAQPSSPASFSG